MVRAMSEGTRLLVVSCLALVVGAAAGGYATRLIYGDSGQPPVDPSPEPVRECPTCPRCPACPPPPDCEEISQIPSDPDILEDSTDPEVLGDPDAPDLQRARPTRPTAPVRPGLSARAVQQAGAAVRLAVAPCLDDEAVGESHGMLLLDLTVTATSGAGGVSDALISQRSGQTEPVEACVLREAAAAQFVHEGADGQQRIKLPLRVGKRY